MSLHTLWGSVIEPFLNLWFWSVVVYTYIWNSFLSSSSSASICFYLYVSWNCVCCLHYFFKLQQTSFNFLIEVKIHNLDWIAKTYFKYGFIKVNKNWTNTTSTINIFILLKISCVQTYKIRTKSNLFLQIHVPCWYTQLCSKHYSIVSFCL